MKNQMKFKSLKAQHSVLLVFFLASLLMLSPFKTTAAQIVKPTPQVKATPPTTQKMVIFKGKGIKPPQAKAAEQTSKLPPAKRITPAQKRNLFLQAMSEYGRPATAVVFTSFELSVQTPYVPDKGSMSFARAEYVDTDENQANFNSEYSGAGVLLSVKPTRAGQWLMIHCHVGGSMYSLTVTGPDGREYQTPYIDGHTWVFINAENTQWQSIFISRSGGSWMIRRCEVSETTGR